MCACDIKIMPFGTRVFSRVGEQVENASLRFVCFLTLMIFSCSWLLLTLEIQSLGMLCRN